MQPVLGGTDPCDQTHKDFITAAAAYSQPVSQSSPQGIGDLTSQADLARLRADAQAADDALAGLVGTFGTLAACRSDVLTPAELRAA
ncbi:hypothetical protein ACS212_22755, partial [Escherichia coli]|uniref:hypothetical protein n=1 Tax=Escherichia coli TaxID=562 RepID=UPI003F226A4B